MSIRIATAAALLVAFAVGTADAEQTAEERAATGAKICAAAPKDFAVHSSMTADELKQRLAALGAPLEGKSLEEVDNSCEMMKLMGGGFGALPPILHLGTNNRQDVAMMLQISGHNGQCMATIVSLDGC